MKTIGREKQKARKIEDSTAEIERRQKEKEIKQGETIKITKY